MRNVGANFVCVIENKVWASEGEGQLAWYRKVLGCGYPDYCIVLVFLTPEGLPPEDPEDREHWMSMSYTDILRLVEESVAAEGDAANDDVLAFLRQYAITLRRNTVPESTNQNKFMDVIVQGIQDAETSLLYTQGWGQAHEPVGQLARAMIAQAEAILDEVSFNVEFGDDQLVDAATVRGVVATVALALSVGANEVVKRAVVDPIVDSRGKRDAVKAIAEAADEVAEEGIADDTWRVALQQLEVLYQEGEGGKVVFQEQYNLERASHVGASSITMFNPGAITLNNPPTHGTYFRRHRMLTPYWTEWTEWVWSGGGELSIDRFNEPLRIAGTDEWITPKGTSTQD